MTLISQSAGYLNFYNTVALLTKEYAPADYVGFYANTTDIGPVTSNGTQWAVIGGGSGAVSVLSFGADPTGVADSTTAFTLAATAGISSGNNVAVPGGTYKLVSAVTGPFMQTGVVVVTGAGKIVSNGIRDFGIGPATAVAGSIMKIDNLFEQSSFPLANEGAIWPSSAYTFAGFSKEFTATTVSGQGNSGPLTTLFAFGSNNGASAQVVGIVSDVVCRQANGTVFGANFIARNDLVNNVKLVGLEIDIEPAVGTTVNSASCGIIMNIFSIAAADPTPVMQVGGVGGGVWGNGFLTSHIAGVHYAVQSGDPTTSNSFINTVNAQPFVNGAVVLGKAAGQAINFGGGAFGTSPYLYSDVSNNLITNMGSGGIVVLQKPGGTQAFTFDQFGTMNMPNNGVIKINTVQVLAQQIVGYGTPTGGSRISSFPGATATLLQTSQMLAQLMLDLKTHGMIGT